jgi:aerobic carbon-monoxide dehydrogenase medium subunit
VKPAPFEYHVAGSVADVVDLLGEHGDDVKPLAGGQSLVPLLALRLTRFPHLVDLNRVESLVGISRTDGWLEVGAMTRQATVEHSAEVATSVPLLSRAVPLIGHFQIRNRGTIGGSISHADPASELPAVALALGAELVASSPAGVRTIPASEFFVSTWTTSLGPDELLTSVRFPVWPARHGAAIEEFARRSGDFAITGAACAVQLDSADRITRAGLGLFGMGSTPVRAAAAEAALTGSLVGDIDPEEIGRIATADTDPPTDIHAPSAYRRTVGAYMVERALSRALEEASRD